MRTYIKNLKNYIGQEVTIKAWVDVCRDQGKLMFFDFRDMSGKVQGVILSNNIKALETGSRIRQEWVIEARGKVNQRPERAVQKDKQNGDIEMEILEITILNEAKTPPFDITGDGKEINEEVRLQYRYIDLRRERMQKNLRMRAMVIKFIRDFLFEKDFVEIETPILGKSTPEGARDYLVPSRLHPGKFYALPQSPQQYKQLLMVAGFEKYFQIVKCFRDEDTRGDRQPEFTQLDLEMSFTSQEEILNLTEELYLAMARKLYPNKKIKLDENGKFLRMSYKEAMEKYNSDKPDIRDDKNNPDELAFLFVVDFPMFEYKKEEKRWDAVHHPFTMPKVENVEDFWQKFKNDPSAIGAYQYDFVLNGYEIAGGSIRIHDPELLKAVFEAMGNEPKDIEKQFGHMFEAFQYGVPPHGGIAPGIDRLMMILQNEPNIREVIVFPKTGDGKDLMMNAPSEVDKKQLEKLGIKIKGIKAQS